jgi:hypothetical protein
MQRDPAESEQKRERAHERGSEQHRIQAEGPTLEDDVSDEPECECAPDEPDRQELAPRHSGKR